ncbi:hypothetical protein [Alteromonas sp. BMJM2]|uniref:hypothetical protein n=1 Tax=Alteromonas sp. BMJM2 TaxID=2954241 RepID=UPI0022B2B85E|nr:hypothetical protein [Alteromonas sp. BMJM2]
MNIVKSVIRGVKKPVIKSILGLVSIFSGRFFTKFDPISNTYITTHEDITLTGKLITIEAVFKSEGSSDNYLVSLSTEYEDDLFGLRLDSGNNPKFFSAGYTLSSGASSLRDGKLHVIKLLLNRVSGEFSVFVDGVYEYGGIHDKVSAIADSYRVTVGARFDTTANGNSYGYFRGLLSNIKIMSDDITVFDMPIDEYYSPSKNTVRELISNNNGTFINIDDNSSTGFNFVGGDLVSEKEEWSGNESFKVGPQESSNLIVNDNSITLERLTESNWVGTTIRGFERDRTYLVSLDVERLDRSVDINDYGAVSASGLSVGKNKVTISNTERLDIIMKGGIVGHKFIINDISIKELMVPQYVSNVSRYFTHFDIATGMHVDLNQLITLPRYGSWEVEIICVIPTQGAYFMANKHSTEGKDRAGILDIQDGRVFLPTSVSDFIGGDAKSYHDKNKLRKVRIFNTDNNVAVSIDGELIHYTSKGNEDPVINSLGIKFAGTTGVPNFRGVMASAKIIVNGELITDIDINERYTSFRNTILNKGTGANATIENVTPDDSFKYDLVGNMWVNDSNDDLENISE